MLLHLGISLRCTLVGLAAGPKGLEDTYRFRLGGVEQVFEGFVCCPQQRPDRAGPFLSVFLSSLFRIVAQECTKEAGVGVLHQLHLHRPKTGKGHTAEEISFTENQHSGFTSNRSFLQRPAQPRGCHPTHPALCAHQPRCKRTQHTCKGRTEQNNNHKTRPKKQEKVQRQSSFSQSSRTVLLIQTWRPAG